MQLDVLYNEDCLLGMKRIPDGSMDMILCDLPYAVTKNHWDSAIPFETLWDQYKRVTKKNAAIVLTASQPFSSALVLSQPTLFRHEWIWSKNLGGNFANTVREPMKEHESVLVFSRGRWTYNKQMQERSDSGKSRAKYATVTDQSSTNYGAFGKNVRTIRPDLRVPSSVQRFNRECGLHPTQKPVALFEYLIRTYTNEGDTVLDSCVGSGTTAIACMNTGRRYIGFEKDPGYFAIAQKRIADHKPQLSLTA
jgi:site-specific DNA-methyltransferase (adenine-specific)